MRAAPIIAWWTSGGPEATNIPPVEPVEGEQWAMAPGGDIAVFSETYGWLPVAPQAGNEAVEAANAFLGIDGLWVAEDGD